MSTKTALSTVHCFWCGAETGKTIHEHKNVVMSHDPCPSCQIERDKGITVIEIVDEKPTGRWFVVVIEFATAIFEIPQDVRVILVNTEVADTLEEILNATNNTTPVKTH